MSTIAAVSTPVGAGGIGILRVSGEDAIAVADAIFISGDKSAGETLRANPRKMVFGTFGAEDFCDKGYAVYFPAVARSASTRPSTARTLPSRGGSTSSSVSSG